MPLAFAFSKTTTQNSLLTHFYHPCYWPWERKHVETTTDTRRSSALPKPENIYWSGIKTWAKDMKMLRDFPESQLAGPQLICLQPSDFKNGKAPGGELQPFSAPEERSGSRGV